MIEKEIAELRRILKAERTSATRVYGCYINGEGAIITEFERSFGLISEEKILPHKARGEGHYCAVFEKTRKERSTGDCRS